MARVKPNKNLTYRGFSDLPIYNFYQVITESDVRYFYKDFIKGDDLKLTEEEEIELLGRFQKVFNDRLDYTNDVKSKEYYRKLTEISNLETKLFRIQNTFNILIDIPIEHKAFKMFVDDFKEEGYNYPKSISDDTGKLDYLEWLKRKIKGFKNKVNIKKVEYKDILEPPKKEDGKKFDLMKEKILLEEIFTGRVIDIYVISVKEFTALIIRAEEKATAEKKQADKIKNKRVR